MCTVERVRENIKLLQFVAPIVVAFKSLETCTVLTCTVQRELQQIWHFMWNKSLAPDSITLLQTPAHFTQFLTQNDQNSTWKSLHLSYNIVYSQICHKYIHIMGWKDQISREIATCQNFASPRICCEQAAAGMLRPFPAHFVLLQSKCRHCNVHGSRAATENWVKCGISLQQNFGQIIVNWPFLSRSTWNLCTSVHQNAAC